MNNGYAQITIAGEKIGLKFGMLANQLLVETIEQKKKIFIGDSLNELGITYVLWHGYINNCEIKQTDPKFNFEVFAELVEETRYNSEILSDVMEAIACWAASRSTLAILPKEDAKKKNIPEVKSRKKRSAK